MEMHNEQLNIALVVCEPRYIIFGARMYPNACWMLYCHSQRSINNVFSFATIFRFRKSMVVEIIFQWSWGSIIYILTHWSPDKMATNFLPTQLQFFFLKKNIIFSFKISLKFVLKCLIDKVTELLQIMVWRRPGRGFRRLYVSLGLDELTLVPRGI